MSREREPYRTKSCRHYCGTALPCHAGVNIAGLRDEHGRIPCVVIRDITGTVRCDLMEMPPDPPSQAPGSMSRSLAALIAERCPVCDEPIRGEVVVDDKVHAMPCRHIIRAMKP